MRIKNWSSFQHFKDRCPPWIKLHRELLDQRDINLLSDRSHRVLIGLWLLASEDKALEGNLPDIEDIAFRLRIEKDKLIKALKELDNFVIQDDINVISEDHQDDDPEKRQRREETETDRFPFEDFWLRFPRKTDKAKAEKAYIKLSSPDKQKAYEDNTSLRYDGSEKRFIPHPTTYINGKRWEDEMVSSEEKDDDGRDAASQRANNWS